MPEPNPRTSSGDNVFTVACVPTGINIGVSYLTLLYSNEPNLALVLASFFSNLYVNFISTATSFFKIISYLDISCKRKKKIYFLFWFYNK